jgi:hypothetical protein
MYHEPESFQIHLSPEQPAQDRGLYRSGGRHQASLTGLRQSAMLVHRVVEDYSASSEAGDPLTTPSSGTALDYFVASDYSIHAFIQGPRRTVASRRLLQYGPRQDHQPGQGRPRRIPLIGWNSTPTGASEDNPHVLKRPPNVDETAIFNRYGVCSP